MPELPEVETIKRGLEKVIIGQTIKEIDIRAPKLFIGNMHEIINQKIISVERRAKVLIINLQKSRLLIHLKMTGQIIYVPYKSHTKIIGGHPDKAYLADLPHKHSHVIFTIDNGTIYFNDIRKFGWIKVVNLSTNVDSLIHKVGPEFDSPAFSLEYFSQKLANKKSITIKQLLLDQSIVAGIGNIYADEILFASKVHPQSVASELPPKTIRTIFQQIPIILNLAIISNGSSSQTYRTATGEMGTYLDVAKVYKREKLPCKICSTAIERIKIAGRSSHFCPNCQLLVR